MCNTQTQQFIDQVVANKVANNVMFTLFDVTLEVKELEKAANLPISHHRDIHDDVAGSANAEALSNGWSRQTRPMGNNLVALVYFNPAVHDVTSYTPLQRKDAPNTAPNPALDGVNPAALAFASPPLPPQQQVSPTIVTNPTWTLFKDGRKFVDRWNRLRVPCEAMRSAGFLPGDQVYAVADNGKLIISKAHPASPIAKYIVDCHHNIRIAPKTLRAAGLSAVSYKMTATTDGVTIEP